MWATWKEVLGLLVAHQLYVNKKKYEFGRLEIAYLEHIVSAQGVAMDRAKVQAMLDWPLSTTLRELRGFLGLIKFVQGYACIAQPRTQQLKKDSFGLKKLLMPLTFLKGLLSVHPSWPCQTFISHS